MTMDVFPEERVERSAEWLLGRAVLWSSATSIAIYIYIYISDKGDPLFVDR